MRKALLFVALLLLTPPVALPAPKASSPRECAVLADMALVARAAAKHGVERPMLEAMLHDIYTVTTADGEIVMGLLASAAYRAVDIEPNVFAQMLGRGCMQSGGDLDFILGTGI